MPTISVILWLSVLLVEETDTDPPRQDVVDGMYYTCNNEFQKIFIMQLIKLCWKFTSHIAAFLSMVLITGMLEICIQTSYDQNVQLILKRVNLADFGYLLYVIW
jgi:hypothetical protein